MAYNKVKFLRGTSDEYAVAEKDSDTIYFTTDDGKLYIGDKEVSGDGSITIDDTLSDTSTNPVQNKVIKAAIDDKADKTVATTEANGLMSASDKKRFNNIGNVYALKSLYGDTTIDVGRKTGTDVGICSDAEGWHTTASGNYSHTEGLSTTASNRCSHAEGVSTVASGESSHAEGVGAVAFGDYSHARGYNTITNNTCETASGKYNVSNDNTLFSIGDGTADDARHNAFEITTTGGKLHDKDIATTDLIPTSLPANGGNADTVDGLHANDFSQIVDFGGSETDTKTAIGQSGKTAVYRCTKWTDYPTEFIDSQGTLIAVNYNGSGAVGTDFIWCTQIIVSPRSGNKMFIRYMDATSVSDWKEISTTPIKSTAISGVTDQYSNLLLWTVTGTDARKPILIAIGGYYAIPFLTADSEYSYYNAGLINCATHEYIPNTAVSGTVYYIEV